MIIHGGEGVKPPSQPKIKLPDQSDSTMDDRRFSNTQNRGVGRMKGVCPGDNIVSSKLNQDVRVPI